METKIEPFYQNKAKYLIDSMFDAKIFSEKMTRDDMQGYEDIIAFEFRCIANTSKKMADFNSKFKLKIN